MSHPSNFVARFLFNPKKQQADPDSLLIELRKNQTLYTASV